MHFECCNIELWHQTLRTHKMLHDSPRINGWVGWVCVCMTLLLGALRPFPVLAAVWPWVILGDPGTFLSLGCVP